VSAPNEYRDLETQVLKGVSRSFYLTLRLLPAPMRGAASLGYLLARASDTLADTETVPVSERLRALEAFRRAVMGDGTAELRFAEVPDPKEQRLLDHAELLLEWLHRLPDEEARLVREVAEIIISGQRLDLERFGNGPGAMPDDAALEDYAWRVAGCVGAFWTKLGFLTMGPAFSASDETLLLEKGIAYGKGLQLVNILRDLPRDLECGRCYLPVAPNDRERLLEVHAAWVERAGAWVEQGISYAATLPSRRLRAATLLPALLARETLGRVRGASWETLQQRVKVPRWRVYLLLLRALAGAG
jgi:farnesyl-diphosphate farnesyltransferase